MVALGEKSSNNEEEQITKLLISIICLHGNNGLPLDKVENEFFKYCGFHIPWKKFGADSLRSWLLTLWNIYIVKNRFQEEVLIEHSPKSMHIKELVSKQRKPHYPTTSSGGVKRNAYCTNNYDNGYNKPYKMMKKFEYQNVAKSATNGSFVHTAISNTKNTEADRYEKYQELESMLPLFYKHQALGDDFFVDIADTKMGYYVPDKGPKQTGLCAVGQTILQLTEKVKKAVHLAPRAVVMIGFQDLLNGHSISSMITDLRQLVIELKKKNTRVTLVTLIPSPKLPNVQRYQTRMDIFNRAILDYATDPLLKCNIIDMNTIFQKEAERFRREFDRFVKVAKNDHYKVFSDYGRKIFLSALKSCLKEQIEYGH